jgi:hypothetical protein
VFALHLINRLAAALVSLTVVAGAVLLVGEVIRWALGMQEWVVPYQDWWRSLNDDLSVGDDRFLVVAAIVAVLGLLLLLFELVPRRPTDLATAPLADGVTTVATRGGVRSAAVSAARSVSGVRSASASVRRRSVGVTVHTRVRDVAPNLRQSVREAVEESLTALELRSRPRVRVSVKEDR